MSWKPPPTQVSNYIKQGDNTHCNGCDRGQMDFYGSSLSYDTTVEILAWISNQDDAIAGFTVTQDGQHGWVHVGPTTVSSVDNGTQIMALKKVGGCGVGPQNGQNFYIKQNKSFPKATQLNLQDPSILQNAKSGIHLRQGQQEYAMVNTLGITNCPGGCNKATDVMAPLGWIWAISDNSIYGDGHGRAHTSYKHYSTGAPGSFIHIADSPYNDNILVGNIGFDVGANFDSMTLQGGVNSQDAIQIRNAWCATKDNIDKQNCSNWYDNGSSDGTHSGTSYATVKVGICGTYDWGNDTTCVNVINQVLKAGSSNANFNTVEHMVQTYCDAHQSSNVCSCYNAVNAGTVDACVANPTVPGCDTIAVKVGKIKSLGAQFLTTQLDPYCACDQCHEAYTSTSGKIILQSPPDGGCNQSINACFSQVTVGSMSGGNLNASCNIQANTTPPASGTGASSGSGVLNETPAANQTGGSGGSGGGGATPSGLLWDPANVPSFLSFLNTQQTQIGSIIALIVCILCCCLCCVLLMKGGGGGNSGSSIRLALSRLR